jgi:hypothetical protein
MALALPLSLPFAAAFPRRLVRSRPAEQAEAAVHTCQGQMRLRTSTEDGREGWDCWCRTGPLLTRGNARHVAGYRR